MRPRRTRRGAEARSASTWKTPTQLTLSVLVGLGARGAWRGTSAPGKCDGVLPAPRVGSELHATVGPDRAQVALRINSVLPVRRLCLELGSRAQCRRVTQNPRRIALRPQQCSCQSGYALQRPCSKLMGTTPVAIRLAQEGQVARNCPGEHLPEASCVDMGPDRPEKIASSTETNTISLVGSVFV